MISLTVHGQFVIDLYPDGNFHVVVYVLDVQILRVLELINIKIL
jgi:hypothetical protein